METTSQFSFQSHGSLKLLSQMKRLRPEMVVVFYWMLLICQSYNFFFVYFFIVSENMSQSWKGVFKLVPLAELTSPFKMVSRDSIK